MAEVQQKTMDEKQETLSHSSQSIEQIRTPKKKPSYEQSKSVKSVLKVIDSPPSNALYLLMMAFWLIFTCGVMLLALQSKLNSTLIDGKVRVKHCEQDYRRNNCQSPVKAAREFCTQKLKCMDSVEQVDWGTLLGEILYEFTSAAGGLNLSIGLFFCWMFLRGRGSVRTIEYVEYH